MYHQFLAMLEESTSDQDLRPGLAYLGGSELQFETEELEAARRRTLFVLAERGEDAAIEALADELDSPDRHRQLTAGLQTLRRKAEGLPDVSRALADLLDDPSLAWRAYSSAVFPHLMGWPTMGWRSSST
jgi:hypothetical protein